MTKAIGLALFVAGVILILAGYNASQSFSSDLSRFFTGSVTNKAMWMTISGVVAALSGAALLNSRNA
ncbi:MAG: hypothetical protein A2992_04310 [Elusimicrobia bacterium RIFCSPLOWO2_01_FULL_59_12]|nr:MAG: hypothetical protein A2992_04310 [Elusimicrobia bacterium RIFCSPLOWO2_01_FULL_59_12]